MAPPPPITPTPTGTPLPLAGMGQGNPAPPTPGEFQAQVEQTRARQAMEAALAKYLRYWGPRYQVAPIKVTVESEWAHGVAQWQSQTRTLRGPIHILAHRLPDGTWQALLPGSDGLYRQWIDAAPESLVPAGEKSQLRAQATEADALLRPQAAPAVPPAPTVMLPSKEGLSGPIESVPGLVQPTVTPTPVSEQVWETYMTVEFGYSVRYPSALQPQERNIQDIPNQGGVPSDVWFGERIHIITRIPPLPDDALSTIWKDAARVKLPQGLQALRLERVSEPIGGGTPLTSI